MPQISQIPFSFGWWASELKGYRPCDTTYCVFDYEALPPLPDPVPAFAWLTMEAQVAKEQLELSQYAEALKELDAKDLSKLENLIGEAERLGVSLPAAFVQFMSTPELRLFIASTLCCLCTLADHIIPCPGFGGAYLIGFLRDQQDCVTWSLCLMPTGEHCVVALSMDIAEALPEYVRLALYGDLDITEEEEMREKIPDIQIDEPYAIGEIIITAPTFEAFVYRFLLEEDITRKLIGLDKTPITKLQQRYLDHYRHQYP